MLRFLSDQRITHLAAVPTLWHAVASAMQRQPDVAARLRLRLAVSSGEPLQPGLLADLQRLLPAGCSILNLYGSTEVSADCTAFKCTSWQAPASGGGGQHPSRPLTMQVPAGHPISETLLAVLEGHAGTLRVAPACVAGQVAVGGTGLAAGYLSSDLAAAAAGQQRFVALPADELRQAQRDGRALAAAADVSLLQGHVRLFLTGDCGWLDTSGCLHLAGRRDLQVKISGGPLRPVCCAESWQLG